MPKKNPNIIEIYNEKENSLEVIDVSEKALEKRARGFILGTQTFDSNRKMKEDLEAKITKRIGRKGKLLSDKLFELIEGVYIVDKRSGKDGHVIKYYQQPPNLQAIIYAMDRVLGKPMVRSETNTEKQGLTLVENIVKGLVNKNDKNVTRANEDKTKGGEYIDAEYIDDGASEPAV